MSLALPEDSGARITLEGLLQRELYEQGNQDTSCSACRAKGEGQVLAPKYIEREPGAWTPAEKENRELRAKLKTIISRL